jgi:hypothetical protein
MHQCICSALVHQDPACVGLWAVAMHAVQVVQHLLHHLWLAGLLDVAL